MADDGVISAYLRELRVELERLPDADDLLAEAEDHLYEVADALVARGRTPAEAETEAVARFGSAGLIARTAVIEAKRGVSVPTRRTRRAGIAAMLAPPLLVGGQAGNAAGSSQGPGHGVAVFLLVLAFPAFIYGLWGLRSRHGGMGRLGRAAVVLAALSPPLSYVGAYGAIHVLVLLCGVAVVAFVVDLLRASVLPVAALALFGSGGLAIVALGLLAGIMTLTGGDAGEIPNWVIGIPVLLSAVGFGALGWSLWRERAVDGLSPERRRMASA